MTEPDMTDRFFLPALVTDVLQESAFFTDPECPFRAQVYAGDPRVVVIVGENASGKSLLFRFVAAWTQQHHKVLPTTISIRERTGAGTFEMSGMRRMFMFGDEQEQSTGATSANVVNGGFRNAGREGPGILMLDEPEIGLSDGYAGALGAMIGERVCGEMLEGCRGVVVVTHNRGLVRGLLDGLQATPTFVCMGDEPRDCSRWLASSDVRSLTDLLRLKEVAGERRKITHRLLEKAKAGRDAS